MLASQTVHHICTNVSPFSFINEHSDPYFLPDTFIIRCTWHTSYQFSFSLMNSSYRVRISPVHSGSVHIILLLIIINTLSFSQKADSSNYQTQLWLTNETRHGKQKKEKASYGIESD